MHLLYIDESGTSNLLREKDKETNGNSQFFVLGAILIKATDLEDIEDNIKLIKSVYFKNKNLEIKSTIKNNNIVKEKKSDDFFEEIYGTIANTSCHCFGTHIFKVSLQEKGVVKSKTDIYLLSFQHLLRSINRFINQNKINDTITVFIDGIDKNHNKIIYDAYKKALNSDSKEFIGFDGRKFSPSINFVDSEFTMGVQLADLVAGALWRGLERNKKINSKIIKKKFPKDLNGNIMNYSYCICRKWI